MKFPLKDIVINVINADIRKVKKRNLTFLSQAALLNISKVISKIEAKKIPGIFVETGCALGGSTILMGISKNKERQLNVYDVFGMIPPPSDEDGGDVHDRYDKITKGESTGIKNDLYYGYEKDLIGKVRDNLKDFGLTEENDNIHLVQGLYEDTLKINEPIAFAHIDCDWYSSVMTSLVAIEPNLSKGGIMIIDDYYAWSGCKTAIDEYFSDPAFKAKFDFSTVNEKLIIEKK